MAQGGNKDDTAAAHGSQGMNQGMQVLSYLIAGVLLYGGLGWLGDHLLGTGFLLPVGIVLGAGFGIYLVVKRFGESTVAPSRSPQGDTKDRPATRRTGEGTT